ncbi:PIG-L family deacetylase [Tamlana sp. 2_MG-2023]|uniref:PIG-L family deacetylase n=1 Tax=unclassified Tamlana TaxID=2614803 RepID=UPI0026E34989|nr:MULTISPECIES: PIG-L family deacetylase [unclassified Tamlana]MDO6759187.1 PIG-L family deacetylase [Tamlana sp. 2_MG-2023]MDO6790674.1 PIG-L family deacetylase [Tamlana sp. 1_MG-2023]
MNKNLLSLMIALFTLSITYAQTPIKSNSSEIYESIQKLNFLGSVLYVAAHPDDENTRLISYMSNHVKARTAYLSLTRGDGGQNLIGSDIRELLGVLRTQELLAARRVDGGEQLFTRANDFGYSKHPDETFEIWDKDDVLSDVVLAIRTFQPDIIINRFDHRSPGTTHGHHTGSAMLSVEAFDLANDKTAFPNQLSRTHLWQPKRLFFNTSHWFYGGQDKFDKADKSDMISFDIGTYYPLKGLSNNEVAAIARSQHLCQGFGNLTQRGTQQEYIEFLKGDPLKNNDDIFEGIDTTWNRIKGGNAIGDILYNVEKNFNFKNPASHMPQLVEAYKMLQNIEDEHWKIQKSKELIHIIEMCAGLYLEASAETNWATPDEAVKLNIEVLNRSEVPMTLVGFKTSEAINISKNIALKNNIKYNFNEVLKIKKDQKPTTPYWLNEKGSLGMYHVEDESLIGLPETPRAYQVDFNLLINNVPFTITKDVIQRYSEPDKGELYRPFEIITQASAAITEKVIIFNSDEKRQINVIVKAGHDNLEGTIEIEHPSDWQISPKSQKVSIAHKGEDQNFIFTVVPPKNGSEGYIKPIVYVGNEAYSKELIEIDYSHIPQQTVLLPSESKVVRLDIQKKGNHIAYIQGAGDVVPESLEQIGYQVQFLKPEDISPESLNKFDAVVVGIRAYNTLDDLQFKQQQLFDFVAQGGNMIVQYNTNRGLKVENIAPYKLNVSRDRVTDENAEVRFLKPNHPVLNYPNKITQKDFEGWTQERGLYFPDSWGKEFTPILELHDKKESDKKGSLLVAKHGKGYYIYTGLSFFREFPAGVSGAYRLFANMLSIGKGTMNQPEN